MRGHRGSREADPRRSARKHGARRFFAYQRRPEIGIHPGKFDCILNTTNAIFAVGRFISPRSHRKAFCIRSCGPEGRRQTFFPMMSVRKGLSVIAAGSVATTARMLDLLMHATKSFRTRKSWHMKEHQRCVKTKRVEEAPALRVVLKRLRTLSRPDARKRIENAESSGLM